MSKKPERAAAERLKTEAQALATAGKLTAALEAYARAVDALPNDAWLHHAAGELARKLKRDELAAAYFRKSGAAFVATGFARYALPALRSSWSLFRSSLPANADTFRELTRELAAVQRALGFETDAVTTERVGDEALRSLAPSDHTANESVPPRESLARVVATPAAAPAAGVPAFRRWLERVRRALSA